MFFCIWRRFHFDASTFEIWGALLNGAKLVVSPDGPLDIPNLKRIIAKSGVSVLWLTAALFHRVVDEDLPAIAGVRQLWRAETFYLFRTFASSLQRRTADN